MSFIKYIVILIFFGGYKQIIRPCILVGRDKYKYILILIFIFIFMYIVMCFYVFISYVLILIFIFILINIQDPLRTQPCKQGASTLPTMVTATVYSHSASLVTTFGNALAKEGLPCPPRNLMPNLMPSQQTLCPKAWPSHGYTQEPIIFLLSERLASLGIM